MGLQRRSWGFPGSRRGKKSLQGSCPGLRFWASPPGQPDAAAEEASSRVTPLAPTRGRKEGAGRGFLAAEESFRGVQGPPPTTKHHWESLAGAASPVLLNTAENCRPQTPDNRSLTGGDGWAQQAADFTHTQSYTSVWGRGCRTSLAGLRRPPSPGSRPKTPRSPVPVGKGRTPTLVGLSESNYACSCCPEDGPFWGYRFSGQEPGGRGWGEVGGFVRELTATNQTGSPGRQGILTNATPPTPQLPRRPDSGMVKGVCAGGRGRVCG